MANSCQFVTRTATAATATTIVCTSGAGQQIPVGSLVVLRIAKDGTATPTSVVDSAGNTYTKRTESTSPKYAAIYDSITTVAIPAGGTWTATFTTTTNRFMDVCWCGAPNVSGGAPVTPQIPTAGASTGTAVACSSVTPGFQDSFSVSIEVDAGAASATPATGWTEDSDSLITSAVSHVETQSLILTSSTAQTPAATLATSKAWQQIAVTYSLLAPVVITKIGPNDFFPSSLATTDTCVTTVAAAVGDLVVVPITYLGGVTLEDTVTDSHGNTWIRNETAITGATPIFSEFLITSLWSTKVTVAMPIGTTITLTISGGDGIAGLTAYKVTGAITTPLDSTPSGTNTGTTATATTGPSATHSPTVANWVAFYSEAIADSSRTTTPQAGWTESFDVLDSGGAGCGWELQFVVGSNVTAMQGKGTLSGAATSWATALGVYKVTPPAAVSAAAPQLVGSIAGSAGASGSLRVTAPGLVTFAASPGASGALSVTIPQAVVAGSVTAQASGTLGVTAPTAVSVAGTAQASGSLSVTTPTLIAAAGTANGSGTLFVTSPTSVGSITSTGFASGLLKITAPGTVVLGGVTATAAGNLSVTSPTSVGAVAGSGSASGTLAVTSPTKITFGAVTATAIGSLALTSPTQIGSMSASGVSTGTLSVTAPGLITFGSTLAQASGALTVTVPGSQPVGSIAGSVTSTGSLIVSAPTGTGNITSTAAAVGALTINAPMIVTLGQGVVATSGILGVTAPTRLTFGSVTASASATLVITGPTSVTFGGAAVSSSGSLAVTAPTRITFGGANAGGSGVLSVQAAMVLAFGSTTATATGSFGATAPTYITFGAGGFASAAGSLVVSFPGASAVGSLAGSVVSSGSLFVTSPTKITLGGGAANATGSLKINAPGLLQFGSSTAVAHGALSATAPGLVTFTAGPMNASGQLNLAAPAILGEMDALVVATGTLAVTAAAQGSASSSRTLMGMGM